MNKVILMGRLTRDPEVRYTQGECEKETVKSIKEGTLCCIS